MEKALSEFRRLLEIMEELRVKCPWDREQTFESLRKLTIEETYELGDAILKRDLDEVKKELGDIMLHVVFYAKLGAEEQAFDMAGILESINKKLIYRHPHVFGETTAESAREVLENWETLKLKEKGRSSVLEGVPMALPALVKANRIQEKASGVGFDWREREQVWAKVQEEIGELQAEMSLEDAGPDSLPALGGSAGAASPASPGGSADPVFSGAEEVPGTGDSNIVHGAPVSSGRDKNFDRIESEFGDIFFAMVNAARLYGVDPEAALERTNLRFIKRFNYLESKTLQQGRDLKAMTLEEMEAIWQEAKIKAKG